jgi:hypothetical protein
MKSFKNFINEDARLQSLLEEIEREELLEAQSKPIEGKPGKHEKGVIHELLTGYYANGGQHMKAARDDKRETPEETYNKLSKKVHRNDLKKMHEKAKSAAKHLADEIVTNHPGHVITPGSVIHTSKAGDTEHVTGVPASQKEDSSDFYFHSHHPRKSKEKILHGKSLKVSDKANKNVPSSSLGMKSSGSKTQGHGNTHKKEILRDYPKLAAVKKEKHHKDIKDARKEWATKNPMAMMDIKERNRKLLHKVARHHASELQDKLANGQHEEVINHVREVLHAHQTPAQKAGKATFSKHTTYVTSKGIQHHSSDPSKEYEHVLKNHKNISVKSSGGSVHFYHTDPKTGAKKKFASQAHKFDSQSDPLSTLKTAGRAT